MTEIRLAKIVIMGSLGVVIGGCLPVERDMGEIGFVVENHRDDQIIVETLGVTTNDVQSEMPRDRDAPVVQRTVPANSSAMITASKGCLGSGAIARDSAGQEIARREGALCDFQRWVFDADGTVRFEQLNPSARPT